MSSFVGWLIDDLLIEWFQEANVLGLHNTVVAYIRTQPDPKKPEGMLINMNSGLAGKIVPGNSAYLISKMASHRYMEFLEVGERSSASSSQNV